MKSYLGEFEELVLLAVARLGENAAYGSAIREAVERSSGRTVSTGALYTTLERLEEKGFTSSRKGQATPQRGGRAKLYFKIEAPGLQALTRADEARAALKGNVSLSDGLIVGGA